MNEHMNIRVLTERAASQSLILLRNCQRGGGLLIMVIYQRSLFEHTRSYLLFPQTPLVVLFVSVGGHGRATEDGGALVPTGLKLPGQAALALRPRLPGAAPHGRQKGRILRRPPSLQN